MANWKNTEIRKRHNVIDFLDVTDNVAYGNCRIGNIIQCDLIVTKDGEKYLAMLITDMVKRGFIDATKLGQLMEEMRDTPPTIDNVYTPCPHTVFDKSQCCLNCGLSDKEIATDG